MTKTEKNKLILKQLLLNLKEKFNITTDFYDSEGHGYFDFGVTENGVEYMFNLYRTHYTVISTLLKGQKGFERGQELENEIESFIKEEIKRINHDLFIKFGF